MSRKLSVRTYGKRARKPQLGGGGFMALGELDPNMSISTSATRSTDEGDPVKDLTAKVKTISIQGDKKPSRRRIIIPSSPSRAATPPAASAPETPKQPTRKARLSIATPIEELEEQDCLRILNWEDVCPIGDRIEKIAEASYAEVYRITNERGTSIIKVIRLESPIKAQTKAQERSGLVDEEPHSETDLAGELRISELVADIPGFVIYKEKYLVEGKTTPALLETHQSFQRKMKRNDPNRLQFYPSPSRYLKDTRFLVVELGDAGTALEDLRIESTDQIWDVFLGVAVALARAENLIKFEHRDLHEGNICFRQTRPPKTKTHTSPCQFGYSGIDVTILDYGLSRAEDADAVDAAPIAHDLERDLSLFTSTHAKQCKVYRQMRSYLINGDRIWLPPKAHSEPYETGTYGAPISWTHHHPYTNALWLAYLYKYLTANYRGEKKHLRAFTKETHELWAHLDPEASLEIMSFSSAEDIVEFAVEAGWITQDQLASCGTGEGYSVFAEESIIESRTDRAGYDTHLRRSPRKPTRPPVN
ncbi:unnamed protein product [Discula destructiva]